MPKETKKLIHIMMTQCKEPCKLTAGGLYVTGFENFGQVILNFILTLYYNFNFKRCTTLSIV